MRLSTYYLPIIRDNPSDAVLPSHRLMLRAGIVRQSASGIYTLLPLGYRVFEKISKVISEECDKAGFLQILMPIIQSAELWQKSGRYDSYGKEMLRVKDRHNREMLFGPTHEEVVTDLLTQDILSYKTLPLNLYQIQWKFRDEIRPRYGVMRAREFCMFDSYSFDMDEVNAIATYEKYYSVYLKIFKRIGVSVIPVKANSGAIGGSLSHEFHVIANSGESKIFFDKKLQDAMSEGELSLQEVEKFYSRADDEHNQRECNLTEEQLMVCNGIEVGHIFSFGEKYSKAMGLLVNDGNGNGFYPHMGSYGIGVTRLIAAIIEARNDKDGIVWPLSVAPFVYELINLDPHDETYVDLCNKIYDIFGSNNMLYDDTKSSFGEKRVLADLLGLPYQIAVGKKLGISIIEIKQRATGKKVQISLNELNNNADFEKYFR